MLHAHSRNPGLPVSIICSREMLWLKNLQSRHCQTATKSFIQLILTFYYVLVKLIPAKSKMLLHIELRFNPIQYTICKSGLKGVSDAPVYLIIKVSYGLLTRLSIQVHAPISPLKITLPQSHSGSQIKRWTSKLVIPLQLSDAQVLSDTKSQI